MVAAWLAREEVFAPSLSDRSIVDRHRRLAWDQKECEWMHSTGHQDACSVAVGRHRTLIVDCSEVEWSLRRVHACLAPGRPPSIGGQVVQRLRRDLMTETSAKTKAATPMTIPLGDSLPLPPNATEMISAGISTACNGMVLGFVFDESGRHLDPGAKRAASDLDHTPRGAVVGTGRRSRTVPCHGQAELASVTTAR